MKKLKLTSLVGREMGLKEMNSIRGGGCTSKCGADVRKNADDAIANVKKNVASSINQY